MPPINRRMLTSVETEIAPIQPDDSDGAKKLLRQSWRTVQP
jgi:hypothetical protein